MVRALIEADTFLALSIQAERAGAILEVQISGGGLAHATGRVFQPSLDDVHLGLLSGRAAHVVALTSVVLCVHARGRRSRQLLAHALRERLARAWSLCFSVGVGLRDRAAHLMADTVVGAGSVDAGRNGLWVPVAHSGEKRLASAGLLLFVDGVSLWQCTKTAV